MIKRLKENSMDSKTRAKIRGLAQRVAPSVMIGKAGVDDGVLAQLDMNLSAHELVKVDVLETADVDKKELLGFLAEKLGAEGICVIGRKLVLYRYSSKCKNHILG